MIDRMDCKDCLSFLESVAMEVLKYMKEKEGSEEDAARRWISASSFVEDSYQTTKAGKNLAEESTAGPSRSIF